MPTLTERGSWQRLRTSAAMLRQGRWRSGASYDDQRHNDALGPTRGGRGAVRHSVHSSCHGRKQRTGEQCLPRREDKWHGGGLKWPRVRSVAITTVSILCHAPSHAWPPLLNCTVVVLNRLSDKLLFVEMLAWPWEIKLSNFCTVTEPPWKVGVRLLKMYRGILDEARIHKHTYEAYKDMINIEINLLQLYLEITR
jgi:hypothetical protein